MRICIPVSADRDWESPVHGHFGSAPFFAVLDSTLPRAVEIVPNGNSHHDHGHCNPVAAIAGLNINAVIVGGIGYRALARLRDCGIDVYRCAGTNVRKAAEAIAAGRVIPMLEEQCCQGHEHGQHGH